MHAYKLIKDSGRTDLLTICDYEMQGFDLMSFWTGCSLTAERRAAFSDVTLTATDNGAPPDLMGNPLSWLIVSSRFKLYLEQFLTDEDAEFFAIVIHKANGNELEKYFVMNVLSVVSGLDEDHSIFRLSKHGKLGRIASITKPVLKSSAIDGYHAFRLDDCPSGVFVSAQLAESLEGKGFGGIAFLRCEVR